MSCNNALSLLCCSCETSSSSSYNLHYLRCSAIHVARAREMSVELDDKNHRKIVQWSDRTENFPFFNIFSLRWRNFAPPNHFDHRKRECDARFWTAPDLHCRRMNKERERENCINSNLCVLLLQLRRERVRWPSQLQKMLKKKTQIFSHFPPSHVLSSSKLSLRHVASDVSCVSVCLCVCKSFSRLHIHARSSQREKCKTAKSKIRKSTESSCGLAAEKKHKFYNVPSLHSALSRLVECENVNDGSFQPSPRSSNHRTGWILILRVAGAVWLSLVACGWKTERENQVKIGW